MSSQNIVTISDSPEQICHSAGNLESTLEPCGFTAPHRITLIPHIFATGYRRSESGGSIHHLDLHIISAQHPPSNGDDPAHLLHLLGQIIGLFSELPGIFIAEVDGLTVGGGNECAVNMDMRFAGPQAKFGIPEVAGGVVHGGGLLRLTKIGGSGQAMESLQGKGSMAQDMQRLVELAHTEEAQDAVSKIIEFGEGDDGHDFELSLPDSEIRLWI